MAQSRFIQSVLDAAREDAGASGAKSLSWFRRKIEEFGKPWSFGFDKRWQTNKE